MIKFILELGVLPVKEENNGVLLFEINQKKKQQNKKKKGLKRQASL